MGIALTTAGVTFGYAVETTAGTRPTTGYTLIPDIKEIPELNPAPGTIETTVLSETGYKTYMEGLKDLGGSLAFKANYTEELQTVWATLVAAYETASADEKAVWFEIQHPSMEKSVFFVGQPSAMGMPAMAVNSVLETSLYIVPMSAPTWEAKSTVEQS